MTLRTIDEKRDKLNRNHDCCWSSAWALDMLDDIEQEIAERYMELPVDADGVPIHVGDMMALKHGKVCEVVAVGETQFTVRKFGSENCVCHANLHRHFKLRTIEEVLRDCCNEWNEHCGEDWESGVCAKYAEEIRGMMA